MSTIIPQLDTAYFVPQILWLAVVFCALYFLNVLVFIPKLRAHVHKREKIISGNLARATELLKEAKAMRAKTESLILDMKTKADSIREKATTYAGLLVAEKFAEVDRAFALYVEQYEKEMEHKRNLLIAELPGIVEDIKNRVVELAINKY